MLPAVGTALLLVATRRGAYLSPDGLAYLGTARNLIDGNGYTPPPGAPAVSNFPPLFPLLLAGLAALGADPLTSLRVVNPVLTGLTALVVGVLVGRHTGRLALGVAAQLLVLAGADFLLYATSGLSEPLFLLLAALTVAALAPALHAERRRLAPVALAGLLAGAACLTRYVGVALVAGGALALLAGARRAKAALAFGLIGLAPLAGWLAWLATGSEGATNRPAAWHPPDLDYWTRGLWSATTWFVPADVPMAVRAPVAGAVVALVAVLAVATWRRPHGNRRAAALVAVLAVMYLGALVANRFVFEVTGRLDARFLLPIHLAVIGLGLWVLSGVDIGRSHLVRIGLSAVVGLQVAAGLVWLRDAVVDAEVRPGGFASPAWTRSEVVDQVRALDPAAPVFTNQVDALWFHTGRVALPLPEKRVFLTGEVNGAYEAELAAMAGELARGGLLVYFTRSPARQVFLPGPPDLERALPLEPVARDGVGIAYRLPSPPAPGA